MYSSVFVKQVDFSVHSHYNNLVKHKFTYVKPDIQRNFKIVKPLYDEIISKPVIDINFEEGKRMSPTLLNQIETYLQIFYDPRKTMDRRSI